MNRLPKICRICRAPDNDDLISVQLIQQSVTIARMVQDLTGIEVMADKNLPQNICLDCLEKLRSAHQLQQQCVESDRLLRKELYTDDGSLKSRVETESMVKLEIEALDECVEGVYDPCIDMTVEPQGMTTADTVLSNERTILNNIVEQAETKTAKEATFEHQNNEISNVQNPIDILTPDEKSAKIYLKFYAESDYEITFQNEHYEQINFNAYKCCGCSERFQVQKDLEEHSLKVHKQDREFNTNYFQECPICFRLFPKTQNIMRHRNHLDSDLYHCRLCDRLADNRTSLFQHLEKIHDVVLYIDESNEYIEAENNKASENVSNSTLAAYDKSQYRLVSTEKDYDFIEFTWFRCCGCTGMFETREDFEAHSKQFHLPKRIAQHVQKPYECSICYERFDKKASLTSHRNRPNKRRVVCRICEGIFKGESNLRKHMIHHHGILTENRASLPSISIESMDVDEDQKADDMSDKYSIQEIEYIDDNLDELAALQDPTDDEDSVEDYEEEIQIKGVSKYAATRQRKQMGLIPGNFIRVVAEYDGYNIVEMTKERCCCCLRFFDSLQEINEHMEEHQTETFVEEPLLSKRPIQYECEYCLKKFDIAMIFVIHKRIREQKQFYQCRLCDFVIDSESRLKNHMLYNDQHAKFFNLIREDVSDRYDIVKLPGLRCCGCGAYFEDENSLMDHSRTEHPRDKRKDVKRKQACSICDRRFNNVGEVAAHQQRKGSTIRYYCKLCDFESPSEARMLKHLYSSIHNESLPSIEVKQVEVGYRKPGSMRYCCFEECCLPFHGIGKLQEHVQEVHSLEKEANIALVDGNSSTDSRWQCDCCFRMFRTLTMLKQHQFPRVPKSFVCAVCGEAKPNKTALTTHEMKHTGERPFSCNLCDKRFTSRTILNSHMKCHFPKQYQCTACGEKFARSENLKRHIRHRHQEATFCCNYCPRKLKTREAQNLHERSHTGEKPFQCRTNGCDKRYASITDRRRHEMANHTGERPHKCTFCAASFVRKRQLTIHERKHTGERPFACDRCGKAFIDAPLLKKHTC